MCRVKCRDGLQWVSYCSLVLIGDNTWNQFLQHEESVKGMDLSSPHRRSVISVQWCKHCTSVIFFPQVAESETSLVEKTVSKVVLSLGLFFFFAWFLVRCFLQFMSRHPGAEEDPTVLQSQLEIWCCPNVYICFSTPQGFWMNFSCNLSCSVACSTTF